MKILIVLTYYRPHTSGLTIYAERLARGLARRGHEVTVMTSRYDRSLPLEEVQDGVRVIRVPVAFRVSKGVIMPTFGFVATRLVRAHDVVCLHLPQFDAAGVAARARLMGKPCTLTYHCDLKLPAGPFNGLVNRVVDVMNYLAGVLADRVVAYTEDFAIHSPYLSRFAHKVVVIPPPVELPPATPEEIRAFADRVGLNGRGPVIGMAARLAAEKGVEVLLEALPRILEVYPDARVLFAGQYQNVLGEEAYARRLAPLLARYQDRWTFLGVLSPKEMAAFYPNLDVIVVPSLNSTESFGLVQVEAMLCGTPSIASDLPGVRQPVLQTGMGEIVPVGDSRALAEAILRVVRNRGRYIRSREEIARRWSTEQTAEAYEALFERLLAEKALTKRQESGIL
ncbi:MAG: glycosyltransferase family 4 protein [Anaerolineae bacterium]|nr:glycosyltransferase family 4 protein [Anaerolineae bacterium]MDW7991927.1 glycosyltransferase family 4 protein [Anaerolineae bacterium]